MMYKVNLHITQKCNYSCKYCFAHFENSKDLEIDDWKRIIDNLKDSNLINEINFAGGEPVLYKDFSKLVEYAYFKGFDLSLITNGSLMLDEKFFPVDLFKKFNMLGISVDSFSKKILQKLGACNNKKEILTFDNFKEIVNKAKTINPKIKIKVNTVVSSFNAKDKLEFPKENIDRWKLLKMKDFDNNTFCNKQLSISQEDFEKYVNKHKGISPNIVVEESLSQSYIIIDNRGNLLDNKEDNYKVVGNLLKDDFKKLFKKYNFDKELYKKRY